MIAHTLYTRDGCNTLCVCTRNKSATMYKHGRVGCSPLFPLFPENTMHLFLPLPQKRNAYKHYTHMWAIVHTHTTDAIKQQKQQHKQLCQEKRSHYHAHPTTAPRQSHTHPLSWCCWCSMQIHMLHIHTYTRRLINTPQAPPPSPPLFACMLCIVDLCATPACVAWCVAGYPVEVLL